MRYLITAMFFISTNVLAHTLSVEIIKIDNVDQINPRTPIEKIMKSRDFIQLKKNRISKETLFSRAIDLTSNRTIREGRNVKALTSSHGDMKVYSSLFDGIKINAKAPIAKDGGPDSVDISVTINKVVNNRLVDNNWLKKTVEDGFSGIVKIRKTKKPVFIYKLELREITPDSREGETTHSYYVYLKLNP